MLQEDGKFVIENYDLAKPFASFFPGIAGVFGIPMWVFYVNRGQGVASYGVRDKSHSVLEFLPANRAWQMTGWKGFRTFLKIEEGTRRVNYEPFQNFSDSGRVHRKMIIDSCGFRLREDALALGLEFNVKYFTLAEEPLAGLVRGMTIRNTGNKPKSFEVCDGLAQIVPCGLNDWFLKHLARTMEAWMRVEFITRFKVPLFKLSVDPSDRPQVIPVKGGNYYSGWARQAKKLLSAKFIVDPDTIFGPLSDLNHPRRFFSDEFASGQKQMADSKTPCAFACYRTRLDPGEAITLYAVSGHLENEKELEHFLSRARGNGYLEENEKRYKRIVSGIEDNMFTVSARPEFDLYCRQTYLDNVLRGGHPLTLAAEDRRFVFHAFSRKHGDLERDYNDFVVQPSYFSQGNGNYRDVNQNRRSDVWFNPDVNETNIVGFFNLLQLDGFNPLVVRGARFRMSSKAGYQTIVRCLRDRKDLKRLREFLKEPFDPGSLFAFIEDSGVQLKTGRMEFLKSVLASAEKYESATHGEGFWVDHWTYNMDALESFIEIFPDRLEKLLLDERNCVFFQNRFKVNPRDRKYVLLNGRVRQFHSVSESDIESAKSECQVRTNYGRGEVYRTGLLAKILTLIINKTASLDSSGTGIEMEADKPGWYDALNGLPGLCGSSVCETMELLRMTRFLRKFLEQSSLQAVKLPEELFMFATKIDKLLQRNLTGKISDFSCWDKSTGKKEAFRNQVAEGVSGREQSWERKSLLGFLGRVEQKLSIGLEKAKDSETGLFHTYFMNEVVKFEKIILPDDRVERDASGLERVRPLSFRQHPLPLFLEAQVHALRLEENPARLAELHAGVRRSELFDRRLKMYKVNASLKSMTKDIGRASAFIPGWLENESIWLHMEYKYILELLRGGMHHEFFQDFFNALIPFQDPARYGRSNLENSSFIVSSAHPDKRLHGNGFVARLSGSTAEFLSMWLWMNFGQRPFRLDAEGKLSLGFRPALSAELFTSKPENAVWHGLEGEELRVPVPADSYACTFLGRTIVVYLNPERKSTFGRNAARCRRYRLFAKGRVVALEGESVGEPYASRIRDNEFSRIEVDLE